MISSVCNDGSVESIPPVSSLLYDREVYARFLWFGIAISKETTGVPLGISKIAIVEAPLLPTYAYWQCTRDDRETWGKRCFTEQNTAVVGRSFRRLQK